MMTKIATILQIYRQPRAVAGFRAGPATRFSSLLVAAILIFFIPTPGNAEPAPEARQIIEQFIDDVRSFEADFEQTLLDQNGETLEEWRGRFWLRRPGRFRWRYLEPFVQEIIGDGERLYQYDKELKQVIIDPQDDILATAPTRFLFDRPSLSQFEIYDVGKLDGLRLIQLEDKRLDTAYSHFLIAFDKSVISTIEMRDAFDQVTRIRFIDARINRKISGEIFKLPELPTDVDILDRTQSEELSIPKPTSP